MTSSTSMLPPDPTTADSPPPAGTGARLLINSPLDTASLDRVLAAATATSPGRIVDYGCGWGETLLRVLLRAPEATGAGIDLHEPDIHRARAAAGEHGLEARATFTVGSAADHRERADLLISMGAYQAFGDIPSALGVLRNDVNDGGRAVFGAEYWQSEPRQDELGHMWPGASSTDCLDLPALVDAVHTASWRVLDLHDSSRQELDAYEVGHLSEREEWLVKHPGHGVTADLDAAWTAWLRGHRRTMGFVTMLLGPV